MSVRIGSSLTIKSLPKVDNVLTKKEGEGPCQAYLRERKAMKTATPRVERKDSPHISNKKLKQLEQESLEKEHSAGNADEVALTQEKL